MSISELKDIVVIIADVISMAILGMVGGIFIMLYVQEAAEYGAQPTGLNAAQKEEVRRMIQSALDTGSA